MPRRLLSGLVIAFAGVVVIGVATTSTPVAGSNPTLGVVLCLASAVAYAIGVTLQKPAAARVAPHQLVFIACLVGFVACLPFAPTLAREAGAASPTTLGWVAYLGIVPTAIGFTTWAFALRHTAAGRLGATTYLVPPLAVLMGWLVLDELPSAVVIAGGALCIAGVVVARSTGLPGRIRQVAARRAA
jgi:drug/metabolite transporter (DMT)-like permease